MECNNACGNGWCCTGWYTMVYDPQREHVRLALWRGMRVYLVPATGDAVLKFDCRCRHLTEQGLCSIHGSKPDVCRRFPEEPGTHLLHDRCPVQGKGAVRLGRLVEVTEANIDKVMAAREYDSR